MSGWFAFGDAQELQLDGKDKELFTNNESASNRAARYKRDAIDSKEVGFRVVSDRVEQIREWFLNRQKRLASAGMCLLAVFVAYHVFTANNGIKVYFHKRTENRALQIDVERLKAENEELTKRVNSLKSDPQTIEKVAREEFKYTRPGEVVYMTQEPQQAQPQPPANATAQKK